jgi:hypothetical protein
MMLIPSMGRPAAAALAAASALENAELNSTYVAICVDGPHSSEQRAAYAMLARPRLAVLFDDQHRGLAGVLNRRALLLVGNELLADHHCNHLECPRVTHVGFMGDDHRVRTRGWDVALADAAGPVGIAYGNDLLRGEELPTSVVMGADVIATTGHMVPPTLQHLYIDDYWKALGIGMDRLAYLPDVVIEHLHPAAGKAPMDDSYRTTNAPERYATEAAAWAEYRDGGALAHDLDALSVTDARWKWRGVTQLPDGSIA